MGGRWSLPHKPHRLAGFLGGLCAWGGEFERAGALGRRCRVSAAIASIAGRNMHRLPADTECNAMVAGLSRAAGGRAAQCGAVGRTTAYEAGWMNRYECRAANKSS